MPAAATQLAPKPSRMVRQRRSAAAAWLHLGGQLLTPAVVFGSLWVSVRLRGFAFGGAWEALGIIACLVCVLVFHGLGVSHARWQSGSLLDLGSLLLAWVSSIGLLLVLGYLTKYSAVYSRIALTTWFVLAFLLLCLLHMMLWSYFAWLRQKGVSVVSAVVGPMTPVAQRLATAFRTDASLGVRLAGYFGDASGPGLDGLPYLGTLPDLPQYVSVEDVDAAYISLEQSGEQLPQLIAALQGGRTAVFLIPNVFAFDLLHSELQSVNGIPVLAVGGAELSEMGGGAKRAMDLVLSAAALVVLSPVLALVTAAVKLDSPGPVLFRQQRCGMHNEVITVWKFRSMRASAGAGVTMRPAVAGDPRITRVGAWLRKTSLDELPQLWNVLCGSMSLVGPRPHPLAFNDHYRSHHRGYMLRNKVRPGITGWAQVNGCRGDAGAQGDIQRRLDYDLEYVRRWSLLLDLWILLRTIPALLLNREVY